MSFNLDIEKNATVKAVQSDMKYHLKHEHDFRYCDEVEKFLSPVLLVFFLGSEAMVCFSAFQLALVSLNYINDSYC
jgi:hypothetical protein